METSYYLLFKDHKKYRFSKTVTGILYTVNILYHTRQNQNKHLHIITFSSLQLFPVLLSSANIAKPILELFEKTGF